MSPASRRVAALVLTAASVTAGGPARADAAGWTFRRSYYSHDIPVAATAWRSYPATGAAYRPAVAGPYPGFSVHGVHRVNRVLIRSGASFDQTILRSDAFHVVP